MGTGIGVGLGATLLVIGYVIQQFKFLPALVRMRVVALCALLGCGAAIVPTILGTWSRQGIAFCLKSLDSWVRPHDAGWASFFSVWLLPLMALIASALWLAYFLPGAARVVFGDVATNDFDENDYLMVWGGAFVIALLWTYSLGPLGGAIHGPIGWLVRTTGPMAGHLLGGK